MTERENFAYLAGIVDGEGHFQASSKSRAQGIRVAVIDQCLVDWLYETFPGTNRYLGARTKAGNQVFVWYAEKRSVVRDLLIGMMPFLVIKRDQAEAMLKLVEHLMSRPSYDVPTAYVNQAERVRRRAILGFYKERTARLRAAVVAARHNRPLANH